MICIRLPTTIDTVNTTNSCKTTIFFKASVTLPLPPPVTLTPATVPSEALSQRKPVTRSTLDNPVQYQTHQPVHLFYFLPRFPRPSMPRPRNKKSQILRLQNWRHRRHPLVDVQYEYVTTRGFCDTATATGKYFFDCFLRCFVNLILFQLATWLLFVPVYSLIEITFSKNTGHVRIIAHSVNLT